MITLKATLATGSEALRAELEKLTDHKLITACAALEGPAPLPPVRRGAPAAAPQLVAAVGVGYDTAAQMLITAGDNANRIKSEAAFAKMCGACPIPAGSGKTNSRHRLYRGGNRQANAALYRVVIVRMRWHQPTIDYVARRTAEGMSKREIIRCLKRYLARELFGLLPKPDAVANAPGKELEMVA